jgi:hypothetical protein
MKVKTLEKFIIILLSVLIIIYPKIDPKVSFNLYLFLSENLFSQLLSINLILFFLLEDYLIGLLLLILFLIIQTTDKEKLKEGFISFY